MEAMNEHNFLFQGKWLLQ